MKVIVFGATGQTGRLVCQQALKAGHEVTAFGRSAEKLAAIDPNIAPFQGNAMQPESVAKGIAGKDAAIVCLGSNNLKDTTTLTTGTDNVIEGMKAHGAKRLIVLSAAGVSESWQQISWLSKLLFKTLLRNLFADHHAQEALVEQSQLNWTIVRAAVLNNKPATGQCTASNSAAIKGITRADLAQFLVAQVTDKTHSKGKISVTG